MQNLPTQMSYEQKQARAQAKRQVLLTFLASGECFTITSIAAQLMAVSQSSAERSLTSMLKDGLLKSESHAIGSRRMNVWGISPHGLAMVDAFNKPYFQLGRTNSSYIPHHLQTQLARLAAETSGWTNWTPGKILHGQGLPKIPDAVATSPAGIRVGIEIERHIKTQRRYEEIISAHLQSVTKKHWSQIHYLTPRGLSVRVERAFNGIATVPVKGERLSLEPKHRAVFKFFDLPDWPAESERRY